MIGLLAFAAIILLGCWHFARYPIRPDAPHARRDRDLLLVRAAHGEREQHREAGRDQGDDDRLALLAMIAGALLGAEYPGDAKTRNGLLTLGLFLARRARPRRSRCDAGRRGSRSRTWASGSSRTSPP
jgi:hypothetical protein